VIPVVNVLLVPSEKAPITENICLAPLSMVTFDGTSDRLLSVATGCTVPLELVSRPPPQPESPNAITQAQIAINHLSVMMQYPGFICLPAVYGGRCPTVGSADPDSPTFSRLTRVDANLSANVSIAHRPGVAAFHATTHTVQPAGG
jgi:hypothetical protein